MILLEIFNNWSHSWYEIVQNRMYLMNNVRHFFTGCNCDVGGSYNQICGKYTGQCKCRLNVGGRACDRYCTVCTKDIQPENCLYPRTI